MVKATNKDVYDILKRSEKAVGYDILLCRTCQATCLRCNFSKHKNAPRHQDKILRPELIIVEGDWLPESAPAILSRPLF